MVNRKFVVLYMNTLSAGLQSQLLSVGRLSLDNTMCIIDYHYTFEQLLQASHGMSPESIQYLINNTPVLNHADAVALMESQVWKSTEEVL